MKDNTHLTSESLAMLLADALLEAGLIKSDLINRVVEILVEEIDARKAAGDY